jgi:hypothetical protein
MTKICLPLLVLSLLASLVSGYAPKYNSQNKCTPTSDASVSPKVGDSDGKHGTYKQGTVGYTVTDSNGFIIKSGASVTVGSKFTVTISFTSGNQIVTDLVGMTAAGVLTATTGNIVCGGGRHYVSSSSKSFTNTWTVPSTPVAKAEIKGVYGPNGGTVYITTPFFLVVVAAAPTTVPPVTKPGDTAPATTAGQTLPPTTTPVKVVTAPFDIETDNPFCPCTDDFGGDKVDATCLSCRKRLTLESYCQDPANTVRAGCPGVAPLEELTPAPGKDLNGESIPTLPPPEEKTKDPAYVVGIPLAGLFAGIVFGVLATFEAF